MMNPTLLNNAINDVDNNMRRDRSHYLDKKKSLKERAKLLQELEYQTGLEIVKTKWDLALVTRAIEIKLCDLHAIKLVIGDVEEAGRDVADDYDETDEILVKVKAINRTEQFDWTQLTFSYRRKLSSTDRCQVKRQTDIPYTRNILVCER